MIERLRSLPPERVQDFLASLTDDEANVLLHDWNELFARPHQLPPPGNWTFWLVAAGRGWGKTRTAAEWIRTRVNAGLARRIAFVGATSPDVRDIMVEGNSGICSIGPEHERPLYEPSKRRVSWPNGAKATLFSAEQPERLRGPEHDTAWCDEIAAWKHTAANTREKQNEGRTLAERAWSNLMFGLRIGQDPRCVVTTTPRPVAVFKAVKERAELTNSVTVGRTYDNIGNLAEVFVNEVIKPYEGTRLGRQELEAELLEDVPGALWSIGMIESNRVREFPPLKRLVVAIDPNVSSAEGSAEAGIVVAGVGYDGHGYVTADLSGKHTPAEWGKVAATAYEQHQADMVVAEVNNGGELVVLNLRTLNSNIPVRKVHASRGKRARAEPVSALYERNLVHHVGVFPELEDQMTSWDATSGMPSPDRMDALVWALSDLMLRSANAGAPAVGMFDSGQQQAFARG